MAYRFLFTLLLFQYARKIFEQLATRISNRIFRLQRTSSTFLKKRSLRNIKFY